MRPISAGVAVLACIVAILFAFQSLSILNRPSVDPSAVQVTQVHSEAQTTILIGILIVLTTISVSLSTLGNAVVGAINPPPENQSTTSNPAPKGLTRLQWILVVIFAAFVIFIIASLVVFLVIPR